MEKPQKPKNTRAVTKKLQSKAPLKTAKSLKLGEDNANLFSLLSGILEDGIGVPSIYDEDDAVDLFSQYLEICKLDELEDSEKEDAIDDLLEALTDLRVGANSGDRKAREDIQEIYDLLEDELDEKSLSLPDIMMIGKILSDAGWSVPEQLRQSVADALEMLGPSPHQIAGGDTMSPLRDIMIQADENPFEAYEFLVSMLASFPTVHGRAFLQEFINQKDAKLNRVLIGFMLHSDPELSHLIAAGLESTASTTPNESLTIERLLRVQPWLPADRKNKIDAVIKSMRQNSLPPVQQRTVKIIKGYASACDGAGTMTIMVTMRAGQSYCICSIMLKHNGVSDVLIIEDMPKRQMDVIVRQLKSSIPTQEIDVQAVSQILGFSLSENQSRQILPPFRLVQACELLGIGTLPPDNASLLQIFSDITSGLSSDQTDERAAVLAHQNIITSEAIEHWYEAGEAVEELLYPVKGKKRRIDKIMANYLPNRRDYWARQCAFSALALCGDKKNASINSVWLQLALIGRDIASGMPLDKMPIMRKIAVITVEAFEYHE